VPFRPWAELQGRGAPRQRPEGTGAHGWKRRKRHYKKLVRIVKNLRNTMLKDNNAAAEPIPSFLSECLVWNVDDE
jgi:hypothetical protein